MENALTFTNTAEIAAVEIAAVEMPTVLPAPAPAQAKTRTAAKVWRTLAHKWDMIAVIAFMVAGAVYGIYAITQMTGF